ncbi:MAG TPA: HAD family hydrolase [Polyangiaceae bacterium]|jgi:putative hydrolase of the HAD superfamily|nr:HAD family hydrolase [Polyangiaceae bacterium]
MSSGAIQGVLVDLDETLYSREYAFWSWIASEAQAADAGKQLDRERIAALDQRGRGDKSALLAHLAAIFGWYEDEQPRLQRFRLGIAAACRLQPGVPESLTRIGAQYRLGMVTNGSSVMQRTKLSALGLEGLFDPLIISEEIGIRKPDPRAFELAIAGWEMSAGDVLFVGDDPVADIAGATAVGMRALRVGHETGISSILMLEAWLEGKRA